ncbi:hypothetical protein MMC14_009174 [Varicellaria rhodocarpa]|nr:hypothetical protein [Varicellaria rhodocarpa]
MKLRERTQAPKRFAEEEFETPNRRKEKGIYTGPVIQYNPNLPRAAFPTLTSEEVALREQHRQNTARDALHNGKESEIHSGTLAAEPPTSHPTAGLSHPFLKPPRKPAPETTYPMAPPSTDAAYESVKDFPTLNTMQYFMGPLDNNSLSAVLESESAALDLAKDLESEGERDLDSSMAAMKRKRDFESKTAALKREEANHTGFATNSRTPFDPDFSNRNENPIYKAEIYQNKGFHLTDEEALMAECETDDEEDQLDPVDNLSGLSTRRELTHMLWEKLDKTHKISIMLGLMDDGLKLYQASERLGLSEQQKEDVYNLLERAATREEEEDAAIRDMNDRIFEKIHKGDVEGPLGAFTQTAYTREFDKSLGRFCDPDQEDFRITTKVNVRLAKAFVQSQDLGEKFGRDHVFAWDQAGEVTIDGRPKPNFGDGLFAKAANYLDGNNSDLATSNTVQASSSSQIPPVGGRSNRLMAKRAVDIARAAKNGDAQKSTSNRNYASSSVASSVPHANNSSFMQSRQKAVLKAALDSKISIQPSVLGGPAGSNGSGVPSSSKSMGKRPVGPSSFGNLHGHHEQAPKLAYLQPGANGNGNDTSTYQGMQGITLGAGSSESTRMLPTPRNVTEPSDPTIVSASQPSWKQRARSKNTKIFEPATPAGKSSRKQPAPPKATENYEPAALFTGNFSRKQPVVASNTAGNNVSGVPSQGNPGRKQSVVSSNSAITTVNDPQTPELGPSSQPQGSVFQISQVLSRKHTSNLDFATPDVLGTDNSQNPVSSSPCSTPTRQSATQMLEDLSLSFAKDKKKASKKGGGKGKGGKGTGGKGVGRKKGGRK